MVAYFTEKNSQERKPEMEGTKASNHEEGWDEET